MQATLLTEVLLPLALAIIMLGMGLTLTMNDFTELLRKPKSVLVGLLGQLVLLPLLAFGLVSVFNLPPVLAIGLMVVAACPGGTTSNIISQLANANIALSVSLTALSTVLCIITTPLIVGFALETFEPDLVTEFSIAQTTVGLLIITLVPISIGMLVRHKFTEFADNSQTFFRRFSTGFLALMILLIVVQEWSTLVASLIVLFPTALLLNTLAAFMGYSLGKALQENLKNSLTLGIEVGIQNATLAILICVTFLDRADLATAAGMYGLIMYLGALILVLFARRNSIFRKVA